MLETIDYTLDCVLTSKMLVSAQRNVWNVRTLTLRYVPTHILFDKKLSGTWCYYIKSTRKCIKISNANHTKTNVVQELHLCHAAVTPNCVSFRAHCVNLQLWSCTGLVPPHFRNSHRQTDTHLKSWQDIVAIRVQEPMNVHFRGMAIIVEIESLSLHDGNWLKDCHLTQLEMSSASHECWIWYASYVSYIFRV